MRCGIIDLGSNTVRLVVYEVRKGKFTELTSEKNFLGILNFIQNNHLCEDGIARICEILAEMNTLCTLLKCKQVACFSTASLRNIDNAPDVLHQVEEKTGVLIHRITGDEEAYYDYLGLREAHPPAKGAGCDVGGGSGQIFLFDRGNYQYGASLPIGALLLYNRFIKGLVAAKAEIKEIRGYAKDQLSSLPFLRDAKISILYTMGGSARATAKLHMNMSGDEQAVDGYCYQVSDLSILLRTLKEMRMDGVALLNRVVPQRAHTIIPGILAIEAIAQSVQAEKIVVIKNGVREGYLLHNVIQNAKGN